MKAKTYRRPAKPTPKPCPSCKRKVLVGLDGHMAAWLVTIDAEALTREGELLMIVAGVRMYATNRRHEILTRSSAQIIAANPMFQIHREHDCAKPTPAHLIAPPPIKPSKPLDTEGLPF